MTLQTAVMPSAYRPRIEALVSAQADPPERAVSRAERDLIHKREGETP